MSLGGGKSQAIDAAAQRLFTKNIPLFAASGNSGNSCNTSPAGAPNVFAVGASDGNDKVTSLTTNGACIAIFAPGQGIKTAWIGSNTATTTLSGTSFATAFVSGTAGLYLSFNTIPTAQGLFDKVINTATLNVLTGNFNGAPNRLVYNGGP
ncbi:MAG: serine proteinase [Podila humilis]|nr:MAG: serine proteinase [Podila humilis]